MNWGMTVAFGIDLVSVVQTLTGRKLADSVHFNPKHISVSHSSSLISGAHLGVRTWRENHQCKAELCWGWV